MLGRLEEPSQSRVPRELIIRKNSWDPSFMGATGRTNIVVQVSTSPPIQGPRLVLI